MAIAAAAARKVAAKAFHHLFHCGEQIEDAGAGIERGSFLRTPSPSPQILLAGTARERKGEEGETGWVMKTMMKIRGGNNDEK